MPRRIAIAGGGTAGHVYPGVALARVLAEKGADLLFIGTPGGPEARLVPSSGFDFTGVRVVGRARGLSPRNLIAGARLVTATARCAAVLARFDPVVVVGTGGYVSLPAALAAWLHRIPIVLHEQNSVPGLANRIASRFARAIGVSFPGTEGKFPRPGVLVGNPVRPEIVAARGREREALRREALAHFDLAHGRKTLLITGGSQGAASINKAALGAYHAWRRDEHMQVLHLVGPKNIEHVAQGLEEARGADDRLVWRAVGFTERMDLAFALADLAVSRGGATTIFEAAASGVPSIIVPHPHTIDDDQRHNAEVIAGTGGAEVVLDRDLGASLLAHKVEILLFDDEALGRMSRAIASVYLPDAAERLASLVEEAAGERTTPFVPSSTARDGEAPLPWRRVHMVGISGFRNTPIARLLMSMGVEVSGSDREDSAHLVALRELGVKVHIGHEAALVRGADAVVFSPAVSTSNVELEEARASGIEVISGGEALAQVVRGRRLIAVTGTHGKSTTTSMVAAILEAAGKDPTYVIGADPARGLSAGGKLGRGDVAVVEADEAYGSFLHLHPEVAVVTNVDIDHLDYYGDEASLEQAFSTFISQATERVVICGDDERAMSVLRATSGGPSPLVYGLGEADLKAANIDVRITGSTFDVYLEGRHLGRAEINVPGRHNVSNALAAAGAALALGVQDSAIFEGLSSFGGIRRRFEYRGSAFGADLVDDYAVHPTEIEAILSAARLGPWKRIVAVFQPHLYSRTHSLWRELGSALSNADVVVVTDVYAAREAPVPGITGKLVAEAACEAAPGKRVVYLPLLDEAAAFLKENAHPGDLVLTMGAGDITTLADRLASA